MQGAQPLSDAAVVLLDTRLTKASKKVRAAAKGDVEGVHDLRVAIRKIRAAISVLEETLLGEDALRKEDHRLSRLFSALGDVRDNDVMVARVKAAAKRRRVKGKGVDRLVDKLERRGRNAKKALRDVMNDDDPKRMLRQIGRRIRKATAKASRARQGDDHRALVRHFASSVITRRYESVLAFELVLPASFDVLHRLRVVIKKLRYAVDFFAEALGESVAGALDAPLQTAQDQLGDLHDHQVVRAEVAATARRQGSPRELALLQKQGDAESKRLLAAFARTWKILVGRSFTATLEKALGGLLAGARRA